MEIQASLVETTIYHEDAPADSKWCLVAYRNINRYTAARVDHFETEIEATTYKRQIEPQTPLVSQGCRLYPLPTYEEYVRWTKENKFEEL
jgi:hypothetical protein|tara:strand:+ start:366 stop:635 length:270 start_codon:yes stop_codon:yes gene_type:complete